MIGDGTRINAECVDPRFLSTSPFLSAQMGCKNSCVNNDEFCIQNEGFCIQNEEPCI